jgi:hypothetical protein
MVSQSAQARYSVDSPYVEPGKTEGAAEVKAYRDNPHDNEGATEYKLKIEHGFTSFWGSELEYEHEKSDHERENVIKWENTFQLTPRGQYWADFGFHLEGEFATKSSHPHELEFGPIIAKSFGRTTATANLYLTREFGPHASSDIEFEYKAQIVYHLIPYFEPALEAYGSPGDADAFLPGNEQRHQIGPGFYGEVVTGPDGGKIEYSGAVLRGLTGGGSPDWTFVGTLEYKFEF